MRRLLGLVVVFLVLSLGTDAQCPTLTNPTTNQEVNIGAWPDVRTQLQEVGASGSVPQPLNFRLSWCQQKNVTYETGVFSYCPSIAYAQMWLADTPSFTSCYGFFDSIFSLPTIAQGVNGVEITYTGTVGSTGRQLVVLVKCDSDVGYNFTDAAYAYVATGATHYFAVNFTSKYACQSPQNAPTVAPTPSPTEILSGCLSYNDGEPVNLTSMTGNYTIVESGSGGSSIVRRRYDISPCGPTLLPGCGGAPGSATLPGTTPTGYLAEYDADSGACLTVFTVRDPIIYSRLTLGFLVVFRTDSIGVDKTISLNVSCMYGVDVSSGRRSGDTLYFKSEYVCPQLPPGPPDNATFVIVSYTSFAVLVVGFIVLSLYQWFKTAPQKKHQSALAKNASDASEGGDAPPKGKKASSPRNSALRAREGSGEDMAPMLTDD